MGSQHQQYSKYNNNIDYTTIFFKGRPPPVAFLKIYYWVEYHKSQIIFEACFGDLVLVYSWVDYHKFLTFANCKVF